MKKKLVRILAMVLCLSLACSLLPAMAQGMDGGLSYRIENGEAILIGAEEGISGDVVIPATYRGYPVTAIDKYAFSVECGNLGSITIPYSVVSIHQEAFECIHLEAFRVDQSNPVYSADSRGVLYNKDKTVLIRAPLSLAGSYTVVESTKIIDAYAFSLCSKLTEVILPEGLTRIRQRAFQSCGKLSILCLPESVTDISLFAFSGCSGLNYSVYENGKYLGTAQNPYYALVQTVRSSVTEVSIHPDTRLIAGTAFNQCEGLTAIIIPEGVTGIGSWAFRECTQLTQISIPESVICIGAGAFAGTSLAEIRIGKNVEYIGSEPFHYCEELTGIWVDEANPFYCSDEYGVLYTKDKATLIQAPGALSGSYCVAAGCTSIGNVAFEECNLLEAVIIPEGVKSIGVGAFFSCNMLHAVTMADSVTELGEQAFAGCSKLMDVKLSDNISKIEPMTFYFCINLRSFSMPTNVKEIGYSAFEGCYYLGEVTLPEGVHTIDERAFYGCTHLKDVYLSNNVQFIGEYAFAGCKELHYAYVLNSDGKYLGNAENPYLALIGITDNDLEQITIDKNTKVIAGGALAYCTELGSIELPEGLRSIGDRSFSNCESLRSITIPNTVTMIGNKAFEYCRFSELTIPASVREIGRYGFYNCEKLQTIRFVGTVPVIGRFAFYNVTAQAFCHANGNEDAMGNYGGSLTWQQGHVFQTYLPDVGFNCTTGGTKTAQCEGCEETDTITWTEAAEHSFERGQCTICGEKDANSCFLTGAVTSSGDTDAVLRLLQNGETVEYLNVGSNTFLWEGLKPGTYMLVAEKENHVTYRTTVVLALGENNLNLTLCRPGDVMSDGDLNIADVAKIYAHVKGTSVLTGYALDCADVITDNRINVADVSRLYARIRNATL